MRVFWASLRATEPISSESTALNAAFRSYFPVIRQKCARILSDADEAQDIAQETFLRLWQSKLDLKDVPQTTAWIYCTSTRLAIDRLRARTRRGLALSLHGRGERPAQPDHAVEARELLAHLARKVPPQELEAAIYSRFDGMGQSEIAALMSISDRTVRRLLEKFDRHIQEGANE